MKRSLILALALSATTLAGCAQLKEAFTTEESADAGATKVEERRPYPRSSSDQGNLGLF